MLTEFQMEGCTVASMMELEAGDGEWEARDCTWRMRVGEWLFLVEILGNAWHLRASNEDGWLYGCRKETFRDALAGAVEYVLSRNDRTLSTHEAACLLHLLDKPEPALPAPRRNRQR